MWTSALLGTKISDFSKFMVCPHGQRGLSQFGHFATRGRGSIFRDFLPLWTALNYNTSLSEILLQLNLTKLKLEYLKSGFKYKKERYKH